MLKKISLALVSYFLCVSSQAESDNVFHNSLMVLDTHLDTPALLVRPGFDIMEAHSHDKDFSQVDIPRMEEGGLDGGFWVIYTPQGPLTKEAYQSNRDTALLRSMAIHNMVEKHSDTFELATLAEDGPRIHESGKKVVYISMENAYPLGEDLSLLSTFYKMGLRMMGPVHFKNNQFGDSSTDPDGPKWGGLSPLGEELVKEANRLGIVLDGSHGHDALVVDLIEQSKTPIILSHTGTKTIYDHPRNIDDNLLKKLAKSGGVIHVNAYSSYLKNLPQDPNRKIAYGKLLKLVGNKSSTFSAKEWEEVNQKRYAIDQEHPEVKATFDDYMEHFIHILKIAGPKHVGVGADWDGGGGVVKMMDVATLPLITQRLIDEGYSKQDLANIWGENALRLIKNAQEYAENLDKSNAG